MIAMNYLKFSLCLCLLGFIYSHADSTESQREAQSSIDLLEAIMPASNEFDLIHPLIDQAREFCVQAKKKIEHSEERNPILENKIEVLNTLVGSCNSKFNMLNADFNSKMELLITVLLSKNRADL
jgi:endonuclease III